MKRRIAGLAGASLVIWTMAAHAAEPAPPRMIIRAPSTAKPDPAAALPGAKIFDAQCAGCHGVRAVGAEGPSLSDEYWIHGRADADIAKAIRGGFDPKMAAFDFTDAQVNDLVAYIRAAFVATLVVDRSVQAVPAEVQHTEAADFRVETVAKFTAPYAFVFLPDGRALITETAGTLRVIEKGRLLPQAIEGIPIGTPLQGPGRRILNIALHPDYARNGWIYLTIADNNPAGRGFVMPEMDGVEQPVVSWAPSPAVSAMAFYDGNAFPRWKGNLLVGSMKYRSLYRIVLKDNRQVLQEEVLRGIDRVRDVGVGPDGCVYLLTDGGLFLRLAPA